MTFTRITARIAGKEYNGERMNKRQCKDCNGYFKERAQEDGKIRCVIDGDVCWFYDSHKNAGMVNHPTHYTSGKIECIDAIESAVCELKGIEAVCTANAIKYLWRWKQKNGAEDLKKATWYIERLLKEVEKDG